MDIGSHVLIGAVLGSVSNPTPQNIALIAFFSVLPDLFQIPIYFRIGKEYHRSFWIAHDKDWRGFRKLHPFWSDLWEIPHSFFFCTFIIVPLVLYLHLPEMAIVAYALHLLIDVGTHRGEWRLKLFYPMHYAVRGFTNAWAWSWKKMVVSWIVLGVFFILVQYL